MTWPIVFFLIGIGWGSLLDQFGDGIEVIIDRLLSHWRRHGIL